MTKLHPVFGTLMVITMALAQSSSGKPPVSQDGSGAPPLPGIEVSGVFPGLAMVADHSPRTEAGTGALMPWADRLWIITYVAHTETSGAGTGLYYIDDSMQLHKHPSSVVGTYANRFIHGPRNELLIGPHVIDVEGNVRTIEALVGHRLADTMQHLTDPENKVYYLAMEGEFFEVDLRTLEVKVLYNLMKELKEPPKSKPHFKAAYTIGKKVVIANNSYNVKDFRGEWGAGRLAEWDGKKWTILEKTAFTEVFGWGRIGIATGWDKLSAIMKVSIDGTWQTYRLPKGSQAFDNTSYTEWMRIREVETERVLMDCHGIFYEVPYHSYPGQLLPIKPISNHLRIIPDFCSWRGMLVLGGNQATPMKFRTRDRNPRAGQPQAGLWFGKTDDLWSFGKPSGWGAVWWDTDVEPQTVSDPFLMTGFDKKTLHLKNESDAKASVEIEVDFLGGGTWSRLKQIDIPANGYIAEVFPDGYSAHWVRIRALSTFTATAMFIYQ